MLGSEQHGHLGLNAAGGTGDDSLDERVVSGNGSQKSFGQRLRDARVAALLTIEELADRSGVSARAISDLERGVTRMPHPTTVRSLAAALGLPYSAGDDLADGDSAADQVTVLPSVESDGEPGRPAPAQLPPGPRNFIGRVPELAGLSGLLDECGGDAGSVVTAVVSGSAGVGKTALVLHWAHKNAAKFRDGQLYLNLGGFGPGRLPVEPADAIRVFLEGLRVSPADIPASSEAQAGLYRSLLSRRRLLIVLDNASDQEQVRPLLAAGHGSMFLVTSRRELAGLAAIEEAHLLPLGILAEPEARQMLTARVGAQRAAAEPAAAAELASLGKGLPLGLSVIAARAAARPRFPLAALAAELREAPDRLYTLDAGELTSSVRAALSWSARRLRPMAARMISVLGVHPGPDITARAAASLAGMALCESRAALDELSQVHLMTEHLPGRYAFHDLVHAYVIQISRELGEDDRRAAIRRSLDHYLQTAATAALLIYQIDPPSNPLTVVRKVIPEDLACDSEALAWFEDERLVLLAVIRQAAELGFDSYAWQLPAALREFFVRRGYWLDLVSTQRIALDAARRRGDKAAEASCHRYLGAAFRGLGQHDEARKQLRLALELYKSIDDQHGQCRSYFDLAAESFQRAEYRSALTLARQSYRLARASQHISSEAYALYAIGRLEAILGNDRIAGLCCGKALRLHRQVGNQLGEALTMQAMSLLYMRAGQAAKAIALLEQAIVVWQAKGDRTHVADMLEDLGDVYCSTGDSLRARGAWQQAAAILDALCCPHAADVRAKLANDAQHPVFAQVPC